SGGGGVAGGAGMAADGQAAAAQGTPGTAVARAPAGAVAVPAAGAGLQTLDLDAPLREARDAFEKAYFEFHLAKEQGSMTRVAEKTGLERTHLYRKLKQLGVDLSRAKRNGA
ncbi:helix-turn-helix domain-containing protein, partial [Tepidimonas sp.]